MRAKIRCRDCGGENFDFHSGPDGERHYAIICLDCGAERVLDDETRRALKEQTDRRRR